VTGAAAGRPNLSADSFQLACRYPEPVAIPARFQPCPGHRGGTDGLPAVCAPEHQTKPAIPRGTLCPWRAASLNRPPVPGAFPRPPDAFIRTWILG